MYVCVIAFYIPACVMIKLIVNLGAVKLYIIM